MTWLYFHSIWRDLTCSHLVSFSMYLWSDVYIFWNLWLVILMISIPKFFSVFLGFSHCFTLFPIGCITLFEFIICVFKKASNQILSALHLKIDSLKKPRDQENHRENQKTHGQKKKQTSLVPFRKRGPSPRPLRIIVFLFLLFSPLRFFCCLEYFVDCVQFRILLHFQLFLALFAALADCILDAERQMTPWLTVHVAVNEKLRFNARMLSM